MKGVKNSNPGESLCPAGLVLQAEASAAIKLLNEAADRLEKASESIQKTVNALRDPVIEYGIRLNNIEKDRSYVDQLEQCVGDCKTELATHLGQHEMKDRLDGQAGKKWGVLSGVLSGPIAAALFQFIHWIKNGG